VGQSGQEADNNKKNKNEKHQSQTNKFAIRVHEEENFNRSPDMQAML